MNRLGALGEEAACLFLQNAGYSILQRNYHTRYGEIDIVAAYDGFLAFIEVKSRGKKAISLPREAVTPSKQKKLIDSALVYLADHPSKLQPRFDVIEIFECGNGQLLVGEHMINAFDTEGYDAAF